MIGSDTKNANENGRVEPQSHSGTEFFRHKGHREHKEHKTFWTTDFTDSTDTVTRSLCRPSALTRRLLLPAPALNLLQKHSLAVVQLCPKICFLCASVPLWFHCALYR